MITMLACSPLLTDSSIMATDSGKIPEVFIAVMGVTGSGKSTFIQTASELDAIDIGHDLKSCRKQNIFLYTVLTL